MEDAKQRVSDLNGKMESLGLVFDETTGQINMSADELRKYAENTEAIARAEAAQSEYNNLLSEQTSLQAKINALEEKKALYNQMLEEGTISQFQFNQLMNEANDLSGEYAESMKDLTEEVDAARDAAEKASASEAVIANRRQDIINKEGNQVKQLAKKYGVAYDQILDEASKCEGGLEEWTSNMEQNFTKSGMDVEMLADKWGMTVDEVKAYCDEWGMSYDEFNEHMKETHTEAGEDVEQLAEKWGVSVEDIQKWIAQNESDLQGWADMMDSDMQAWEDSVADHTDNVINDWEKLPDKYDKSLDEMIEIAQENAAKYSEWSDKMAYLSQHMSAESIGYLQELGPAGLSVIDELLDGGVPKMQEFDKAVSGAAVNAANNFSTISPAMIETFNELNSASGLYMNEFGDILNKHSGEAIASASQILSGDELPESIGTALDNTKAVLEQKGAENTAVAAQTSQETANASV